MSNDDILPFRWYGGKYRSLEFILSYLPQTKTYVEPFGGSSVVLLNREPSPIEVYNDIDNEVVNFFKVLRENKDKLLEQISLTPFSREELKKAVKNKGNNELSDIERARLFFIRVTQTRRATAQTASEGRWAFSKSISRRGVAQNASRYYGRLDDLKPVADRLIGVQIENRPAIKVIEQYDTEETLFYCDPPYPHGTRVDTSTYEYEMSNEEHRELSKILRNCDGKVAISGYQCDLYEELYENNGWYRVVNDKITSRSETNKQFETMWLNYEPNKRNIDISSGQKSLKDY